MSEWWWGCHSLSQLCCLKMTHTQSPILSVATVNILAGYHGPPVDDYHETNNESHSQNNTNFRTNALSSLCYATFMSGQSSECHCRWVFPAWADGSDVTVIEPAKRILSLIFSRGPWIPALHFTLKQPQPFLCKRETERERENAGFFWCNNSNLSRCDQTSVKLDMQIMFNSCYNLLWVPSGSDLR